MATVLCAQVPSDVPARWPADAATLPLLAGSPINCLLVEAAELKPGFRAAAQRTVLAVVHPGQEPLAATAIQAGADALVLEGDFAEDARTRLLKLDPKAIEFRARRRLDSHAWCLQLVNYSDYPVDSITVHLLGKFRTARLVTPEMPAGKALKLYDNEDGSGVDIDTVSTVAALILDR